MKAAANVSFSASTASGFETACQKPGAPAFFASQMTAAIGRTTMTSRYVEMTPTDRPVVARPSALILREIRSVGAARALTGRASDRLLDLDHPPVVQVE